MGLMFSDAEKHIQDTIVFSDLNMAIPNGQVISVYTNVNVRETLVGILTGDTNLSYGNFTLQSDIGFLLLQDGLYERLKVNEMLTFTKRLYASDQLIESIVHMMQLEPIKNRKIHQLSFSEQKRVQMACLAIQALMYL
ncbi:hypothetical protein JNUCC1_01945 [Lentibacillus sp. JNUCC-1]|uniref:hypothetical protein n=1 Tax=Lentibacillus sp. JNUCC-1 TaxID=2654513 RepID=UPI0012E90E9B|nr:hypothetical protein [Lentibacillus sp. JNUCC-1]MUV38121.1 hypothetical protein [Lentibacillus sp. JNUCC-1]